MKILYFGGGLGNQIFEYAFYLTIKDKFPNSTIYGVFDQKRFKEHVGGFEIEKIFNVNFPKSSFIAHGIMNCIMAWNKFVRPTKYYCHNLTSPNYNAILFNAHKMNKAFYENRKYWITFKSINLNSKNRIIVEMMQKSNSVAIHVRRGDFLSSKYAAKHCGVATTEYYSNAISYIKNVLSNPQYFIFSDDISWCKENLKLDDATYVDWNKGKDSYLDMYLMTHTKANIIANSTFSYWGAYLNQNNPIVIYPNAWKHSETESLDIFPESWISMKNS